LCFSVRPVRISDSILAMTPPAVPSSDAPLPAPPAETVEALRAALVAAEARATAAEAIAANAEKLIAELRLTIAKLRHERFGQRSERGRRVLEQLELQLEELAASAAEDTSAAPAETASQPDAAPADKPRPRPRPVRGPLPAHLPRERRVLPSPSVCPCCSGQLTKLGEDVTETLEVIPRQYKVIQTVREKFSCRKCEAISQPPAPFHPIARGRAGASLLAMILYAKYGNHVPIRRIARCWAAQAAWDLL